MQFPGLKRQTFCPHLFEPNKVTRDAKYISSLVTFPYCLDFYDFPVARRSKLQHMREILFITYHRQKAVKVVRKGDSLPFPYVVAIGNRSKKVNPPGKLKNRSTTEKWQDCYVSLLGVYFTTMCVLTTIIRTQVQF